MFLTVTRRVCADSVLHLECPLDQLLDVYGIWMGIAEDKMCAPKGDSHTACKATDPSDLNDIVNVGELCQNKTLCELSFYSPQTAPGADPDGNAGTCSLNVLSVTYSCVSKYCIEINKSLQFLAVLADSANTDKAVYGTISNIYFCSTYIRDLMTNLCVNIVFAFITVESI